MPRPPSKAQHVADQLKIKIGYVLRYEDVVSARLADTLEQQRLRIDERQPVLDDWRRCYDQANQLIEVSRRIVNPLLHELVFRYP